MSRLATVLCVVLFAATAFASSYLPARYHNGNSGTNNGLTLTAVTGTFSITASSTITVYDSNGVLVSPQPDLIVNPSKGTLGCDTTTINADGSEFPPGGQVVISDVETTGSAAKPTGVFSTH